MSSPKESAISSTLMHLLLVGENKDDFTHLRDLLNRTGDGHLGLDHARSPEEALVRLGQTTYDLLLCECNREMAQHCGCCMSCIGTVLVRR